MGQGWQGNVAAPRVRWDLSAACRCDDRVRRQPELLASFKTPRGSAEVSDALRVPVEMEEDIGNARRRRHIRESHFRPGRLGLLRLVAVCQDAFVEPRAIRFANWATCLCRPLYDSGRFRIS